MKRAIYTIFGLLIWLAGAGQVAFVLVSETLETNWPIIHAILGVGFLLYALVWISLENAKTQREQHYERVERALRYMVKSRNEP